jgi:hypothetical protein
MHFRTDCACNKISIEHNGKKTKMEVTQCDESTPMQIMTKVEVDALR